MKRYQKWAYRILSILTTVTYLVFFSGGLIFIIKHWERQKISCLAISAFLVYIWCHIPIGTKEKAHEKM